MIGSNVFMKGIAQKVALKNIEISKPDLNVGLEMETMSSIPQVPFLTHVKQEIIKPAKTTDTDIGNNPQKGAEIIPFSKDFYLGNPL